MTRQELIQEYQDKIDILENGIKLESSKNLQSLYEKYKDVKYCYNLREHSISLLKVTKVNLDLEYLYLTLECVEIGINLYDGGLNTWFYEVTTFIVHEDQQPVIISAEEYTKIYDSIDLSQDRFKDEMEDLITNLTNERIL